MARNRNPATQALVEHLLAGGYANSITLPTIHPEYDSNTLHSVKRTFKGLLEFDDNVGYFIPAEKLDTATVRVYGPRRPPIPKPSPDSMQQALSVAALPALMSKLTTVGVALVPGAPARIILHDPAAGRLYEVEFRSVRDA